ncbi:MAG: response regulator transcription factor [Rhizobiaceae bacterium]|nr:response regulator transcription factor [Rhizobiaceae bacterium]
MLRRYNDADGDHPARNSCRPGVGIAEVTGESAIVEPKAHMLVVEDDPAIAEMLLELIKDNGFDATAANNASEMDRLLLRRAYDLVILDAMLPGEDGFSICRRLRASSRVPILMLTALREDVDRIIGIELGADDYVTKPFNPRELLARIKALLRRASYISGDAVSDGMRKLTFSGWVVDPRHRQVTDPDGAEVSMTTAEFDLLAAFCRNPNRILSREQLLSMTHAGAAGPVERSIDAHISRLRQKIEPNLKDPALIKTVRLGGYMFTTNVELLP